MWNPDCRGWGLLVLMVTCAVHADEPPHKRLIEWSAVEPTTAYMREHIREMEQLPFDGLVFHLRTNDNEQMVWKMWGNTPFKVDQFSREIADLEATAFVRFTERFLRCNVTPGDVDWSDDDAWRTVTNNFATAAHIVHRTGCRGIMFDTEQYVHKLFAWPPNTREVQDSDEAESEITNTATKGPVPTEVTALVRQRGQEWIRAINAECPEITILVTYAWRAAQPTEGESFRVYGYELIPAFLDGALAAASDGTRIVDAWEYSYPYQSRAEFENGRRSMKQDAFQWTTESDEYALHVSAAFGLWMDFNIRGHAWHTDDVSRNYNSPKQFRQNLDNALELTDEFVWIYTGQAKWWTDEALPDEYRRALDEARAATDR